MVHLPAQFDSIPREQLLFAHPSPIEKLPRLSSHLAGSKEATSEATVFWIKREDCNSGLAFGGNKIRKLEYVIADALNAGCDVLVTTGGVQSNHMRATSAVAGKYGLRAVLAPRDAVPGRPAEYFKAGNIQLNSLMSAETFETGKGIEAAAADIEKRGQRPYIIPSGASKHPLGGLGFARCAFEIIEQEHALGVHFDTVIVAAASGSTLGGLVAGFALAAQEGFDTKGSNRRLIGIDAFAAPEGDTDGILQIARNAAQKIGVHDEISPQAFVLDRRYNAGSYGRLDDATVACIRLLANTEGILLDPVYTGKAFTGLVEKAKNGEFQEARNVLFIHTGGQSSLSAYPELV